MTLVVRQPLSDCEISAIDELAGACLRVLLLSAEVKNVALRAVIRLASEELVKLEGHDRVAELHARMVRLAAERKANALRSGVRSR